MRRRLLQSINKIVVRMPLGGVLLLSAAGVFVVGVVDYLTGYEVAFSVFYLAPVAVAAWYCGRKPGVAVSVLACVAWYLAEAGAGRAYSNTAIPVWNAAVRLGFFLTSALLLSALHDSYRNQRKLARTDSLTGLHSRRAFHERLDHDLALAQRGKTALSLAYIDVDDFKAVNDAYGHAGGDAVLRSIADSLRSTLRDSDMAARLGGDEFALILPETDAGAAHNVVARLAAAMRESLAGKYFDVSCSIGVVTFLNANLAPESAIAEADDNMYRVKKRGKGNVEFTVVDPASPGQPAPGQVASRFGLVGGETRQGPRAARRTRLPPAGS